MAPTVALCEQQRDVIAAAIPVPVGLITGSLEPKQWTDPALWRRVVNTYRIMVTTPQVLLDALTHGYIQLGRDVGLLVFDEAHHGADKHPYNLLMRGFYDHLPKRGLSMSVNGEPVTERPYVLGLTASPIFGGQVEIAFQSDFSSP
jgi:endoribonuclease Dicer